MATSIEPVRKRVVVAASQEHAFRVFTEGMDRWWPRQHHIGTSPLKEAILEPRAGGRWYSLCQDGTECDVGKVLAWQLTGAWQYDASFVTEVEVTFVAEGPKRTRVELEHRHLERYGDAAPNLRKSIDAPDGWLLMLEEFARAAAE
jgi:hypothetical protein